MSPPGRSRRRIAVIDLAGVPPHRKGRVGFGRVQVERTVRPMLVVMPRIDVEDALELGAAEDQQPVEALPSCATDPALDVRVRVWSTPKALEPLGSPLGDPKLANRRRMHRDEGQVRILDRRRADGVVGGDDAAVEGVRAENSIRSRNPR
jgi:hypothetical protein